MAAISARCWRVVSALGGRGGVEAFIGFQTLGSVVGVVYSKEVAVGLSPVFSHYRLDHGGERGYVVFESLVHLGNLKR